jgi:glucosamine--fructose-6-phosphate aminotransferase (isomerizing)
METFICHIHASGYPSAELKHGVIALITPELPSGFTAPEDSVLEKTSRRLRKCAPAKARSSASAPKGCEKLARVCDDIMWIPECPDYLTRC